MAVRREYLVTGSKIFLDGLGFGGGFDNDEFHGIPNFALRVYARGWRDEAGDVKGRVV
jgi:hypothetical protein